MSPIAEGTSAAAVLGELRTCWQGFLKGPDGNTITLESGPLAAGQYLWFPIKEGVFFQRTTSFTLFASSRCLSGAYESRTA